MEQNFSKIKRRILLYADNKGFSKRKIYQDTGIANGVFDKKTGLSEDNIERFISTYSDVNPTWLLTGDGPMLKGAGSGTPQPEPPPQAAQAAQSPRVQLLEEMLAKREEEIKELNREVGKLQLMVEQLKKDSNKAHYITGTSELERKK